MGIAVGSIFITVKGLIAQNIKKGSSTEIEDTVALFQKLPCNAMSQKGFSDSDISVEEKIGKAALEVVNQLPADRKGMLRSFSFGSAKSIPVLRTVVIKRKVGEAFFLKKLPEI